MELDALRAHGKEPFRLSAHVLHGRVDRAEGDEAALLLRLVADEFVDAPDPVGPDGHGQDHLPADARQSAALQEHLHGAVHVASLDVVKIPDALGGLHGDLRGVDVGVDVDDIHVLSPLIGRWAYYSTVWEKCNAPVSWAEAYTPKGNGSPRV